MKLVLGTLKSKGEELSAFLEPRVGTKPELSGDSIEIDVSAARKGVNPRLVKTYVKRFLFTNGVRKDYRVFVDGDELTLQEQEKEEEEEGAKGPKPEKPKAEEAAKKEEAEAAEAEEGPEAPASEAAAEAGAVVGTKQEVVTEAKKAKPEEKKERSKPKKEKGAAKPKAKKATGSDSKKKKKSESSDD